MITFVKRVETYILEEMGKNIVKVYSQQSARGVGVEGGFIYGFLGFPDVL